MFLSVQADFTFLSFQGALRIAIKAPGLIAEYPIWILALSLLSLLSFPSDPILLPAYWLGAYSFLLIITILWLLLLYFFKASLLSVASTHAGRGRRGRREPRAVPAGLRLGSVRLSPAPARPEAQVPPVQGSPFAPPEAGTCFPPALGRG